MSEPAVVSGRVTNTAGGPENGVSVRIAAINVGTVSTADGSYRLVVPGSRIRPGEPMTITASRVGLATQSRSLSLTSGAQYTQNFQLGGDVMELE